MNAIDFIPKTIHQTWKDENIPEHYKSLIQTWKDNHPAWQYLFWTDEMNRDFIKNNYPYFLEKYDDYPYNIQRVDSVRYFILYHFGGVFIDMDFESLKNIDDLLENRSCVFGTEPLAHKEYHKKDKIICNAFMASAPKNGFFASICNFLNKSEYMVDDLPKGLKVLYTTGPFMLTDVYDSYLYKENITLIPADLLYPLDMQETRELILSDEPSEAIKTKIDAAIAVHYFLGSWWENQ